MSLTVEIEKKLPGFHLCVSFQAEQEVSALLGASGSGKSMTLRCIAGIECPDRGRILLEDRVLFDSTRHINLTPQERQVGYLFQSYALFPHMTVFENIQAGMGRHSKAERIKATEQLLERFYIQELRSRLPGQLSGGQQQRVALARILGSQPKLLLLDEPFSAMDTWLRWQLEQELSVVLEAFPGPTLLVSHNRNEVYRLCSRVGVMNQGTLEGLQEKWKLFHQPGTVEACLLTGCKNIATAAPQADGSIYATEWGVYLRGLLPANGSVGHVGIHAQFFVPGIFGQPENSFPVEVCQVIEDTFSFIVLLWPLAATEKKRENLIRWEVSKMLWKQCCKMPLALTIAPENVIFLA